MMIVQKMGKPIFVLVVVVLVALVGFSLYQVFKNVPFFNSSSSSVTKEALRVGLIYQRQHIPGAEGFKDGLREMGYTNIAFEDVELIAGPNLLAETEEVTKRFVGENVDLIFTGLELNAISALKATKEMNSDIPIVYLANFHDPVTYGLAESFTSSGNNATGVALNIVEVIQKQLGFLREINPDIKKIGVFSEGFMLPFLGDEFYTELKTQALRLGFEIVEYKTAVAPPEAEKEWYKVAAKIKPGDIDAIYHIAGHYFEGLDHAQESEESKLANRLEIPMVAPLEDLPNGGHFGYSSDFGAAGKQAAIMADKIFRGAKPSDIPLEFTSKNILMIYLDRAQQAGIMFPDSMLSIADIK